MAATRSQMPPTNLKERIAALEQRNAANRPTSPTGGVPAGIGIGGNAPHAAGFKDKIAKFEKKGGVPVPRGRFGLGAPPTAEGPRKQGELYGNRIPAPVRHVSAGAVSTLSSVNGGSGDSTTTPVNAERRAVSLSNFNAEFDEQHSRSPSPSFQTVLNGADGLPSPVSSPATSTTALQLTDSPPSKPTIIRGTSFQKAMELARNTENAKQKSVEPGAPRFQVERQASMDTDDSGHNTPVIMLSAEDTPSVVLHRSPVVEATTPSFISDASARSDTIPTDLPNLEAEGPQVAENEAPDQGPSPAPVDEIEASASSSVKTPEAQEVEAVEVSTTPASEPTPTIVEPTPSPTISPAINISSPSAEQSTTPSLADIGSNHSSISSKKVPPTLDGDLTVDALASPLSTGTVSATTLADALSDYFKPESLKARSSSGTVTPPAFPSSTPLSPAAKLAYDVQETELSIMLPDQASLLSPIDGSINSAPTTPASVDEAKSASVSQATRVTPTTGRGVPLFLPSNTPAQTRKSDFVYFPPTPEAAATEFKEPDMEEKDGKKAEGTKPTTFKTVVHGKVLETAPGPKERLTVPETPQSQRFKRTNTFEPPPSPGQGELAALWYEAALLESSLESGELPAEAAAREAREAEAKAQEKARAAKAAQEKAKAAANATQVKRSQTIDDGNSASLKHTYLVPLPRSKTTHRKEVSASATTESFARLPAPDAAPRPKSSFVPENIKVPPRPVTPDTNGELSAHSTPQKSAKQRFGSFRRLGSINMARPSTMYSTRNSQSGSSEMSAEDSPTVLTPVDNVDEFGHSRSSTTSGVGDYGQLKAKASTPSLSSKKSGSSVNRAASFAGKMWSRARTKSSGSGLSTASDDIPRLQAPLPDLPNIQLPHLPHIAPPPPIEKDLVHPPQRATSLKHPMNLPPIPSEFVLPLPTTGSSAFFSANAADVSSDSLMAPDSSFSTRPSSWASFASTAGSSLPQSPLFDESFINSFPSVPETTTLSFESPRTGQSLGRSASILTTVKERPSLDAAPALPSKDGSDRSATPTPR